MERHGEQGAGGGAAVIRYPERSERLLDGRGGKRSAPYDLLPWAARGEDEVKLVLAAAGLVVWMNAKEAAAFLGYSPSEFNRLAASEEIPRHKRGAGYRYNREELSEWLLSA